jgi:hypothetical protein
MAKLIIVLVVFFGSLAVSAQTLPDAPKAKIDHSFFDKKNVALMAVSAAAISADGWTTRQNNIDGFSEINPVARPFVHSNGKAALYFGSSQAAIIGGMYLLHRTNHHKLERILPLVAAGVEGFWTAHNVGLRHTVSAVVPPDPHYVAY